MLPTDYYFMFIITTVSIFVSTCIVWSVCGENNKIIKEFGRLHDIKIMPMVWEPAEWCKRGHNDTHSTFALLVLHWSSCHVTGFRTCNLYAYYIDMYKSVTETCAIHIVYRCVPTIVTWCIHLVTCWGFFCCGSEVLKCWCLIHVDAVFARSCGLV